MNFTSPKGLIALDIDGTLTSDKHGIPPQVAHYLLSLAEQGWQFIFITGRPFQWAQSTLLPLDFSYVIAAQNGAIAVEVPSQKVIRRKELDKEIIQTLSEVCQEHQTDFTIYSGFDNQDICYYRPQNLSRDLWKYLERRSKILGENWQAIDSFHDLAISSFTSVKCFAQERQALSLGKAMEKLGLHAPPNRDPFDNSYFVIQGTHPEATKGLALQDYLASFKEKLSVIAAGDDYNDYSMLLKADVKVVMENAPLNVLQIATIIAPAASSNGIIQGLTQAITTIEERKSCH